MILATNVEMRDEFNQKYNLKLQEAECELLGFKTFLFFQLFRTPKVPPII